MYCQTDIPLQTLVGNGHLIVGSTIHQDAHSANGLPRPSSCSIGHPLGQMYVLVNGSEQYRTRERSNNTIWRLFIQIQQIRITWSIIMRLRHRPMEYYTSELPIKGRILSSSPGKCSMLQDKKRQIQS
jgi:hypothetical protein